MMLKHTMIFSVMRLLFFLIGYGILPCIAAPLSGQLTGEFSEKISGKIIGGALSTTFTQGTYFPSSQSIPAKLLEAIALVESGQRSGKTMTPWPWSINVEGKGYTYATKEKAIQAVRHFQAQGFSSIDVGVMQINLKHHPDAFITLEDAFDPQKNITYAAKFLLKLYMKFGGWHQAIKHYHSSNPTLGQTYLQKVLSAWARAKTGQGGFQKGFSGNFQGGFNPMQVQPLLLRDVDLPEPQSFQSDFPIGEHASGNKGPQSIPISVSFSPLRVMGERRGDGIVAKQKERKGGVSHGGIFPLSTAHVRHRVTPQKSKESQTQSSRGQALSRQNQARQIQVRKVPPLVLAATDLLPLH